MKIHPVAHMLLPQVGQWVLCPGLDEIRPPRGQGVVVPPHCFSLVALRSPDISGVHNL